QESSFCTVRNSTIKGSEGELIFLNASEDCFIIENNLTGGWSGVGTSGINEGFISKYGYRNKIKFNTISDAVTAYITVNDRDALVDQNTIFSTNPDKFGGPGIRFGHESVNGGNYKFATNAICTSNNISGLLTPSPGGDYEAVAIKLD